jgi:hypothetical protein
MYLTTAVLPAHSAFRRLLSGTVRGANVKRVGRVWVFLCGMALLLPGPAAASHSYPQPYPWYWDVGNDGTPDASVGVDADGGGWTQSKLDRLTAATNDWAAATSFEPFRVVSGPNKFFVDGSQDTAYCGTYPAQDEYLGATCVHKSARTLPGQPGETYFDISQTHTTMSTDPPLNWAWWYESTHSGSETSVDFQGVVMHEMGHWLKLVDVYGDTPSGCNFGTGMYTMCGEPQSDTTADDDTWRLRGLTTDDISAANLLY